MVLLQVDLVIHGFDYSRKQNAQNKENSYFEFKAAWFEPNMPVLFYAV
jgi:hypothetical protein